MGAESSEARVFELIGRVAALDAMLTDSGGGHIRNEARAERDAVMQEIASLPPLDSGANRAVIAWKLWRMTEACGTHDPAISRVRSAIAHGEDAGLGLAIKGCSTTDYSGVQRAVIEAALEEAKRLGQPGR